MAFSSPVGDVVILFLVFLPGGLTLLLYRYFADVTVDYSPVKDWTIILLASGCSMSLTLLGISVVGAAIGIQVIPSEWLTLSQWRVEVLASLYVSHIGVAALLGVTLGHIKNNHLPPYVETSRKSIWDRITERSPDESLVHVFTGQGNEIRGYVKTYGSPGHSQDIRLYHPHLIQRNEGEICKTISMGHSVYVHEQDISQIYFADDF